MRSRLNILIATAAMALVVPQFAIADEVADQLRLMNERMSQMEEQLQATQDELDASQAQVQRQENLIEKAGLGTEAKSGLAGMAESINVSGWLAASYFYNFSQPDNTFAAGQPANFGPFATNGPVAPFHPDSNSFNVDQLWFEIEKAATEESRAGFRADIVYGRTASILNAPFGRFAGDQSNDVSVYQAYVEYLTPFGPTVKAGKFGTLFGAEVTPTVYNYNITRSNTFTLLQPINHTGILLDGQTEGGFIYSLGAVNSFNAVDPDFNNGKTLVARLGWGSDTLSGTATVLWGPELAGGSNAKGDLGTLGLLVNWDPTESFSSYAEWTYQWADGALTAPGVGGALGANTFDSSGWGLAMAGRYALTERLGLALRGEVVRGNKTWLAVNATSAENTIWGITTTVDYALAENLTVKGEVRYDNFQCEKPGSPCNVFYRDGRGFTGDDQWLGGVEVVYAF